MNENLEQSQENLEHYLSEQLQFIKLSADSYDAGYDAEAKRLAVSIRVLLHDTDKSYSLLNQLNRKDIKFYDTSFTFNPNNILTHGGLTAISTTPSQPSQYVALLDNLPPNVIQQVDFDEWWNKVIFVDNKRQQLTRKQLVIIAANQDGGAHVDPKIDETYANLSRNNSLAWMNSNGEPMGGPERAAIRQIAHEVLKSLIPGYENKHSQKGQIIVTEMTATVSDSQPIRKSSPKGIKIGRNDRCFCGSGKKYKRCCGR